MSEFYEEEDFDLLYGDELDLIRDTQEAPRPAEPVPTNGNEATIENENPFEEVSQFEDTTRKRLFRDVSPLKEIQLPKPKKLKPNTNENLEKLALIEHIIELRKQNQESSFNFSASNSNNTGTVNCCHNISLRYPNYPCVPLTCTDDTLVYVRCHSEEYQQEDIRNTINSILASNESSKFTNGEDIWQKVHELQGQEFELQDDILESQEERLWSDVYKPQKYLELISDESTNRTLLHWIKLWDKVVFHKKVPQNKQTNNRNFNMRDIFDLDSDGRPKFKLALLAGPPGLGKTTLAHIIARHAGYKPLEVNASDERSVDSFRAVLDNATTMSSVLNHEQRPNCIIFDEIDGAPQPAIDFLVKYATGQYKGKGKKKCKQLKRPIVCICNDLYVPALRVLRQHAIVLHVPPVQPAQLAIRLKEVAVREGVEVSQSALVALGEKARMDVRSALGSLQFLKNQRSVIKLEDVLASEHLGRKDVQKPLFQVWNDVFTMAKNKQLHERRAMMLESVYSFGDYDRLAAGVYENYVHLQVKDSSMEKTSTALEWFCLHDELTSAIGAGQNYSLSTYLPYAFVMWHFMFAASGGPTSSTPQTTATGKNVTGRAKILYPSVLYEVRTKRTKVHAGVADLLRTMPCRVRAFLSRTSVLIDVMPLLNAIITPVLRPVNLQLLTPKEKTELARIVDAMIDYGLNYVQERQIDGTYVFNLDPNIEDFVISSANTKKLSYVNRQLIAREIEVEKMRRLESSRTANAPVRIATSKTSTTGKADKSLPNHLQTLQPVKISAGSSKSKPHADNFLLQHRAIKQRRQDEHATSEQLERIKRNCIYFQFKEGHTNAVRKTIKIASLL